MTGVALSWDPNTHSISTNPKDSLMAASALVVSQSLRENSYDSEGGATLWLKARVCVCVFMSELGFACETQLKRSPRQGLASFGGPVEKGGHCATVPKASQ